ncbi:glycosyltransferase family 2 protein [Maridesulfovibrio sp. FT414]|uniref:glycosyltransferase family 2 protein n=1 Tax=Maridesulfovibrio sp. FT414 TaxID=2979469 RepID=UPI003D80674A
MNKTEEKSSPEISVIMPTYNRSEYIGRALDSVFAQTFKDFECIVIDDGSTDDTLEKLSEIEDERLKVFSRENGGVSAARNQAISLATGRYVALLDSDDEWLPNKLEKQHAFMKREQLHICQTDEIWFRKGKRVNQSNKYEKPDGFFWEQSLAVCLVSPSCTMFTMEFWDDIGPFDEFMLACEDYDLWIRAGIKYPIGLIRERLTIKYGGRPDQLTNSVSCLDTYRIYAMAKLYASGVLSEDQKQLVSAELRNKSGYYIGGCRKRGRDEEADRVEFLLEKLLQSSEVDPAEFIGN